MKLRDPYPELPRRIRPVSNTQPAEVVPMLCNAHGHGHGPKPFATRRLKGFAKTTLVPATPCNLIFLADGIKSTISWELEPNQIRSQWIMVSANNGGTHLCIAYINVATCLHLPCHAHMHPPLRVCRAIIIIYLYILRKMIS